MKTSNDWAKEIKAASQGDDYYFYSHADALIEQIQADARAPLLKEIQEMDDIMCGWADSIGQEIGYTNTAKYMREFASKHQKGHIGHEPF